MFFAEFWHRLHWLKTPGLMPCNPREWMHHCQGHDFLHLHLWRFSSKPVQQLDEGCVVQCFRRCLVNSAQNQLGPILTWPKTNSAQLNNQFGPCYVPTQPKHDSCLFLYYFLPFLAPVCLSIGPIWFFFSFFLSFMNQKYRMASRYKTLEYKYIWLCTQYEVGLQYCTNNSSH